MTDTKRFASIDILRGFTVVGMILVNTQGLGDKFLFLRHCSWNGCRFADLVFPFFLFIVGASMFFVFKKTDFKLNAALVKKILKRGFLIFLIGFLLNIFPFNGEPANWRIMGVMQRIAIVYVSTSFIVLWLKSLKNIAICSSLILIAYWILIAFTGDSLENNVVLTVDKFLFGEKHLYTGYGIYFDPEGLLSSLPAIVNALIGYMTSTLLIADNRKNILPWRTFLMGVAMIVIALIWNIVFPFNKPLWTSSFVLYTSGWAVVLLVLIFWIVDIKGFKSWSSFFMVFGTNALLSYVISELLLIINYMISFNVNGETYYLNTYLDKYIYSAITMTPMRAMLWGVTMVIVCWALIYPLYRKRIFVKL